MDIVDLYILISLKKKKKTNKNKKNKVKQIDTEQYISGFYLDHCICNSRIRLTRPVKKYPKYVITEPK